MTKIPLKNHQIQALSMALNMKHIGIFHKPGLGKTRTALEIYKELRRDTPGLKLLVLCPDSIISQWGQEGVARWTDLKWTALKNDDRVADVGIINYESFIRPAWQLKIKNMIERDKYMIIVDESSRMKNYKSMLTKTLLKLRDCFIYRIVMSGTPNPNSMEELWGQISFLRRGVFPDSFFQFRNTYFHLARGGQAQSLQGQAVSKYQLQRMYQTGWQYDISRANRELIMKKIAPLTHWVKRSEVVEIDEEEIIREVQLTDAEQTAYTEMRRHLAVEIQGETITAQVLIARTMKLRQATSGFYYTEELRPVVFGCTKLKELNAITDELGDDQAIIWTQFVYERDAIKTILGDKCVAMDGNDRDSKIEEFKAGRVPFLLAHPLSAGHGLDLINCSMQIFFSWSFSFEHDEQCRNRTSRIGQTRKCTYIYIVARDTLDQNMLDVVKGKKTAQEAAYDLLGKKP